MEESIIFHHPAPIDPNWPSGGQIRPLQMIRAFQAIGYDCEIVMGDAKARSESIARLKREASTGRRFAFAYAESSSMPTMLTEAHHLPTYPLMDFAFFRWMHHQNINIGLFYRDIHWRFSHYRRHVPAWKRLVATVFYRWDWLQYQRLVDHLFLPSRQMAKALPSRWPEDRLSALPPGAEIIGRKAPIAGENEQGDLRLLYVGGVAPPNYDLAPMFEGLRGVSNIKITICCRKTEWEQNAGYYGNYLHRNVRVIHVSGEALRAQYQEADLFLMVRTHQDYLSFSSPYKFYEALGYGLPIITSEGTISADMVAAEGLGWVIGQDTDLAGLLLHLQQHPAEIEERRLTVETVRVQHTWELRATQVAETLTGSGNSLVQKPAPGDLRR